MLEAVEIERKIETIGHRHIKRNTPKRLIGGRRIVERCKPGRALFEIGADRAFGFDAQIDQCGAAFDAERFTVARDRRGFVKDQTTICRYIRTETGPVRFSVFRLHICVFVQLIAQIDTKRLLRARRGLFALHCRAETQAICCPDLSPDAVGKGVNIASIRREFVLHDKVYIRSTTHVRDDEAV